MTHIFTVVRENLALEYRNLPIEQIDRIHIKDINSFHQASLVVFVDLQAGLMKVLKNRHGKLELGTIIEL